MKMAALKDIALTGEPAFRIGRNCSRLEDPAVSAGIHFPGPPAGLVGGLGGANHPGAVFS